MSSAGKPLPPPDLRFDTSDTAAAPVSRVATPPVVAAIADRSRPLVVKIPPLARGSEADMHETDGEEAASLAAGSVMTAAPPVPAAPVAGARVVRDVAAKDAVAAPSSSEASSSSRRLVFGSAAAGTCLAVVLGTVVWGRSSAPASEKAPSVPTAAPVIEVAAPVVAVAAPAPAVVDVETCSLDVRPNITDAVVWVDGKRVGPAPATFSAACSSIANVEVRHPRYATFAEAVTLDPAAPNGITTRTVQMEREKTTLTVTSEPVGAQVTYNGSIVGKTPLVVKVPRFEQGMVVFSAPNHASDWRKIIPNTETKTVSIKLKGMILRPGS